MATYVAFLRAINLGARRKFPKADVQRVTTDAGFDDVATHLNTGNVRLSTRMRSRERIEAALEKAYEADRGFEVPAVVLSADELLRVVAEAADFADDPATDGRYVYLLKGSPDRGAAASLEELCRDGDRVSVGERAVHVALGTGFHETRLTNAAVEKRLGLVSTARALTVVRAVTQKWC